MACMPPCFGGASPKKSSGSHVVLASGASKESAQAYLSALCSKTENAGSKLSSQVSFQRLLKDVSFEEDIQHGRVSTLFTALLKTKVKEMPQTEAAQGVADWTVKEQSLLGDVSLALPVSVYDNGATTNPTQHKSSLDATLIYTCGACLESESSGDGPEVFPDRDNHALDSEALYRLLVRRLVPCFSHINEQAAKSGKLALVTVPHLISGEAAKAFKDSMAPQFVAALKRILEAKGAAWKSIKAVYVDTGFAMRRKSQAHRKSAIFGEVLDTKTAANHINFVVRPNGMPPLSDPSAYADEDEEMQVNDCQLFSFVKMEATLCPGTGFWRCSRGTSDAAAKAAATNVMELISGAQGIYNKKKVMFLPQSGETWVDAAMHSTNLELSGIRFVDDEPVAWTPENSFVLCEESKKDDFKDALAKLHMLDDCKGVREAVDKLNSGTANLPTGTICVGIVSTRLKQIFVLYRGGARHKAFEQIGLSDDGADAGTDGAEVNNKPSANEAAHAVDNASTHDGDVEQAATHTHVEDYHTEDFNEAAPSDVGASHNSNGKSGGENGAAKLSAIQGFYKDGDFENYWIFESGDQGRLACLFGNGVVAPIQVSGTTVVMQYEGQPLTGTIANEVLTWSDGDVWKRFTGVFDGQYRDDEGDTHMIEGTVLKWASDEVTLFKPEPLQSSAGPAISMIHDGQVATAVLKINSVTEGPRLVWDDGDVWALTV